MKRAALLAIVLAGAGCGSDKAARHEGGPEHATKRRSSGGIHEADPNPAGMTVDASIASAARAVAGRIVWERVIASSVRFEFRCDED